jgi:hypothetical protein
MEPNADYYFSNDKVIAELKCLHTDPSNQNDLNRRLLSVCKRLGYSAEQALQIGLREIALPQDVAQGVIEKSLGHIRKALRKADHQIAATKQRLGRADAAGLVIIANENNTVLSPNQLIQFMSRELRTTIDRSNIDGVIFMTVNLYYPIGGDGAARALWIPGYRHKGTNRLTDFVDRLGAAWNKFRETLDDDLSPSVQVRESSLSYYDVRPFPSLYRQSSR